ncbi:hypothetical protein D3C73_718750 [compost metagenome]
MVGDFVLVTANEHATDLQQILVKCTNNYVSDLKVVSIVADDNGKDYPRFFRAGDHVAFWNHNIKSVYLGDTAGLRNSNYHSKRDLPNTLSIPFLTDVTKAVLASLITLSSD